MNCKHNNLTLFMESKIREVLTQAVNKVPVLSSKNIEDICLIRARKGKFIWQIFLSAKNTMLKCIFIKAIKPKKKNLPEIMLYGKNPQCLRFFIPTVYGVIKKYGFYWLLLEELKQLPSIDISLENFKKPIELMASLHSKFYSNSPTVKNEQVNWAPCFKREWQTEMNRFKFMILFRKYERCVETMRVLKKDKVFLKAVVKNSKKTFSPLLDAPHSLIHGCFEYHHVCAMSDNFELKELRLIDWENISFAPVTLDLVYLIEKSVDCEIHETIDLSKFRNECLNYYCAVMKNYGISIDRTKFQKLYELTFAFKIITQFIFEELKKIKEGKSSNYNFYRDQLFALDESLNLTG